MNRLTLVSNDSKLKLEHVSLTVFRNPSFNQSLLCLLVTSLACGQLAMLVTTFGDEEKSELY